jgi:hypothetical protein
MPQAANGNHLRASQAAPREIIPPHPQHSFRSLTHDYPSPICGWGFHPEYEIHLIQHTTGSFIAGDYIGTFGPGQVTLMGPNLPHDWVSDLDRGVVAFDRDAVIQFTDEWIKACMKLMPETADLTGLLQQSTRGLLFSGGTAARAADVVTDVLASNGTEQISNLFRLLAVLSLAPAGEVEALASEWLGGIDRRERAERGPGRPRLHLGEPDGRHPPLEGRALGTHVRAVILQVLQEGGRDHVQRHGQEAENRPGTTPAGLDS